MRHGMDFNQTPFLVIWEVTQACALACKHCRAEAIDRRDPDELNTQEGCDLIEDVARMETPVLVLSGGDPLQRDDLETLVRHAKESRMRVGAIAATTERLTAERMRNLHSAGLDQMALSLDGSTAQRHDGLRGVEGSFEMTMRGADYIREAGLPLQINTCFGSWNYDDFDAIAAIVERLGVVFWEVFFLVPTGRGQDLENFSPRQYEDIFARLYALQKRVSFIVKITEAQHYRRYVFQQEAEVAAEAGNAGGSGARDLLARAIGPQGSIGMAPQAVNAGKGFCFVGHTGEVFPSGFLPLSAGNVRQTPLAEIYRESPLFKALRDPTLLEGRCGRCEYRELCGGSRSRAYALTGNYFAEDPCCAYEPASASV